MHDLELWGGHEYTVNRVGDVYFDQTHRSGHQQRIDDINLFARLEITALRYPVLWERVAPDSPERCDWAWTDERLDRLKHLGVRPIVGLVHHGSGPHYATLETPAFASGLGVFARQVAERYPWVRDWTPVNEPLTTARFCGLYGHWYPHARDERTFWLILLNEIDGIRLAMREIRRVIPDARLIQTEDLGRTYCTPAVAEQAAFDNARRWMTWDLLMGHVRPCHPLWLRLTRLGLGSRLSAIANEPCPPDIIGVNHYLTSDRFLDARTHLYPEHSAGGNRFLNFADVEAVRVVQPAPAGFRGALEEAWARYQTPLALTEVHNGCTRDEQMRWLAEAWDAAKALRRDKVDIRGVTVWSLLGAYDWDSLLTKNAGHYEPGAFDISGADRRPTALSKLAQSLAAGTDFPLARDGQGWWRRDIRLQYAPVRTWIEQAPPRASQNVWRKQERPILITGATGTLGRILARTCEWRNIPYILASREDFSICDQAAAGRYVEERNPQAVINAAGWVRVDEAEDEPDGCMAANADGALALARICAERNLPFVTFSSDLVFDGQKCTAYVEDDPCRPLSIYGQSKLAAERAIAALGSKALIVRTAAFFSPYDQHNFAAAAARCLSHGVIFEAADDITISPTFVPDLANAALDLLLDREHGIWHVANGGAVTWADFARMIAAAMALDESLVVGRRSDQLGWTAVRPVNSALASRRGSLLPKLHCAIERYAASAPRLTDSRAPRQSERSAATGATA